jgi:uncharacterized membrane protein
VALAPFVGGQLVLVLAIVPVLRGRHEEALSAIARRFGIATAAAVVVLLATGVALASHFSRWQDRTLQLKLVLVALVGVLIGLHIASPRSRAISLTLTASSLVVVWLGVVLSH